MKCIKCGTDNKLKDRTENQGRCRNCRHRFVFEPTTQDAKVTDPMFLKAIEALSVNNTLFFTKKQFFYFLEKRLRRQGVSQIAATVIAILFVNIWAIGFFGIFLSRVIGPLGFSLVSVIVNLLFLRAFFQGSQSPKVSLSTRRTSARSAQILGVFILGGGIFFSLFILKSFPAFAIYVVLGMTALYLGTRQLSRVNHYPQVPLITRSRFEEWLNRWIGINNEILKLLPEPRQAEKKLSIDPEVTAYSFDRLVVCDQDAIAQMLIANNFHFENNCALLSITGYPHSIFQTVMEMLQRNPDLKVYALHSCTPQGLRLIHQLRNSPRWFHNSTAQIFDVGLRPKQILAGRGAFIESSPESAQQAQQLPANIRQELSATELNWLEQGNYVDLESFPPQVLIQVLNRSISTTRSLEDTDTLILLHSGDTGAVYSVESFG